MHAEARSKVRTSGDRRARGASQTSRILRKSPNCPDLVRPLPPLLRWAGSKRQSIGEIARFWDAGFTRYVEPFAGSAALFFHLRPTTAVLSDINDELMTTYAIIVDDAVGVAGELAGLGDGDRSVYYLLRNQDPTRMAPARRAARFLYLNRYCFNGLYRTNALGRFNVPFGGDKSGTLPDAEALRSYADALATAELMGGDFEAIVDLAGTGDFVYLDPPYAVKTEWRRGHHYTQDAFEVSDVYRLDGVLKRMDGHGAKFVLSYADSPEGRWLARDWHSSTTQVRRSIAGSAFKRVRLNELLISNLETEVKANA